MAQVGWMWIPLIVTVTVTVIVIVVVIRDRDDHDRCWLLSGLFWLLLNLPGSQVQSPVA